MLSAKKQRALELQRMRRVAKAMKKAGIREGHYKITEGGKVRWFRTWIEFYPKTQWMIEEMSGLVGGEALADTRRKLDDETKAKLEDWL